MAIEIRTATTTTDRETIFRLRYEIYVEEIGYRYQHADHERRLLTDPGTRQSRLLMAMDEGRVVGTAKCDWGGEVEFTDEERMVYDLGRFLPVVKPAGIGIFSRFMAAPSHRSGDVPIRLFDSVLRFLLEKHAALLFLDCRPHLINTYERLGFRTYTRTYSDPMAGLLVPLVLVLDDREHLRRVGARWLPLFDAYPPDAARLREVVAILPDYSPVHTVNSPETGDPRNDIEQFLSIEDPGGQISIFDNLDEADVARLVAASHIIECQPGDRIIAEHVTDQTVFLVLEGVVEVRKEGRVVAVLTRGAVLGEIAFMLQGRRTADVFAASAGVRILALRHKSLTQLIESESKVAARFLLNFTRILCVKLAGGRRPD